MRSSIPTHIHRFLSHGMQNNRLGHALLFLGEDSALKEHTAYRLAAGLLCENKTSPQAIPFGCGECSSCKQVLARRHWQVHVVLSPAEQQARELSDPGTSVSLSNEIGVDAIRKLSHEQHMQGEENTPRIWIFAQGNLLTKAAANSFLKTLEEPGPNQFFIFLAPSLKTLLPTIASRCQRLFFPSASSISISNEIKEQLLGLTQKDTYQRLLCIEQLSKNKDKVPATLKQIQLSLMEDLRLDLNSNSRFETCTFLKAIENALFALKGHGNAQLVLEDLFLRSVKG